MSQLDLIYRILAIIFPIFSIVLVGFLYARHFRIDMSASNRINMDIFTPMLVFDTMSSSGFVLNDYVNLAFAGLLVVLGSGLLALPFSRFLGFQWKTFLPPLMFCNSGNMGLPLVLLAFGKQGLPAAIVLFVLENFLHFTIGTQMLRERWSSVLLLVKNPMVLATIAGITVSELDIFIPDTIKLPIHMLGQIAIPLMLFSLGVRLTGLDFRDWRIGLAGAVIGPITGLIAVFSIIPWIALPTEQIPILILFSVLPPAILNYLVAEQYQQEPHLVASIVLIGNLSALISIPAMLWFIL